MSMASLNGLHHLEEQSTTQLHNANIHKLIKENHELKKEKEEQQKQFNSPQEADTIHYREQIKKKGDEIL